MVSGSISLPSRGSFHAFPHGTCSLSVGCSYLALDDGPPRFPLGFTCLMVLRCNIQRSITFDYKAITSYGWPFQIYSSSDKFLTLLIIGRLSYIDLQHQRNNDCRLLRHIGLGSSPFVRHYLGNLFWFLFLQVLRCFTSLGCPYGTIYSFRT